MNAGLRRFDGTVALVTGAAGAIGVAIVQRLAKEGAKVFAADMIHAEVARAISADLLEAEGPVIPMTLDVTDAAAWHAAAEVIGTRFGRLDILIHNAGILVAQPLESITMDDFERLMRVNVFGPFLGTKLMLPLLKSSPSAAVVMTGSTASIVASPPNATAYGASKGAIRAMTNGLAEELSGFGIRVNCVHPGPIRTAMTRILQDDPELAREVTRPLMISRLGLPEEVAAAVAYLAASEAGFTTASHLVVDGGFSAR